MIGHRTMVDRIAGGMGKYLADGEHQLAGLYVTPRPSKAILRGWFVVATEHRLIVSWVKTLWSLVAGDLEFTTPLSAITISVEYRAFWDRLELHRADGTTIHWFARFDWRSDLERLVYQIGQANATPMPPLSTTTPHRALEPGNP